MDGMDDSIEEIAEKAHTCLYKCDDCNFRTDVETEMKNHLNVKHIENITGLHCEKCNITCRTNEDLKGHLQAARCKVHIDGRYCEKCNITFITNDHLKEHIQKYHALGPKCHKHTKKRLCREESKQCMLVRAISED